MSSARRGSRRDRRRDRSAKRGDPLSGPQVVAIQFSRLIVMAVFYSLPILIIGTALVVWLRELADEGSAYLLVGALAFFLPVGWGSIALTLYGRQISRFINRPNLDLAFVLGTLGYVIIFGLFAFGRLGTPLWQAFFLGTILGLAITVRASEDGEGVIVRFFSGANRQTILVLGSAITGLSLFSIFNVTAGG